VSVRTGRLNVEAGRHVARQADALASLQEVAGLVAGDKQVTVG
jgi:hypothetical protein